MNPPDTPFVKFAKALRFHFATAPYEMELLLLLCFLFLLFFLWFLLRKKPDQENNVRQPQADVDFFNLVILQKGLEEAEQMVLLELSRQFRMVPIYSILLQESAFDKLIGKIQQEIALSSSSTNLEEKLELAQKLRKKLFPS